jgi:hypothetical protein
MMKMTYAQALEIALSKMSADDTFSTFMHDVHEVGDCVETKHSMSEVMEKLTALKASLDKKSSAEKKPTKTQQENANLAEQLLTYLRECGEPKTVSDMLAECECVKGMSNQKVSGILRTMLGSTVERVEEKRKAYFRAI